MDETLGVISLIIGIIALIISIIIINAILKISENTRHTNILLRWMLNEQNPSRFELKKGKLINKDKQE